MTLQSLRSTTDDRVGAGIRIALAILFVMTGVMKVAVPILGAAFAGQLAAANIPFQELNRTVIPFMEIGIGGALVVGFHARIATMLVVNMMFVATYVHLVVNDASLFPLQPEEPIIPAVVLVMSAYVLVRGAGTGSLDLKATRGGGSSA